MENLPFRVVFSLPLGENLIVFSFKFTMYRAFKNERIPLCFLPGQKVTKSLFVLEENIKVFFRF